MSMFKKYGFMREVLLPTLFILLCAFGGLWGGYILHELYLGTFTYKVQCGGAQFVPDAIDYVRVLGEETNIYFNDGTQIETTVPCVVQRS